MKNINNLKISLIALKKKLIDEVHTIDNTLKEIDKGTEKKYCPKCLSADLRYMKNNKMFCRACGYDNRIGEKES